MQVNFRYLGVLLLLVLLNACNNNYESPALGIEEKILVLVNEHRISMGKPPLEMSSVIMYEARKHSKNMALSIATYGHDGFSERIARIKEKLGSGGSGENVAHGHKSAESVMEGWLNSPGHRANIEGDYTLIGIGAIKIDDKNQFVSIGIDPSDVHTDAYYTQIFYKK